MLKFFGPVSLVQNVRVAFSLGSKVGGLNVEATSMSRPETRFLFDSLALLNPLGHVECFNVNFSFCFYSPDLWCEWDGMSDSRNRQGGGPAAVRATPSKVGRSLSPWI
jgi:hypothetical protein